MMSSVEKLENKVTLELSHLSTELTKATIQIPA